MHNGKDYDHNAAGFAKKLAVPFFDLLIMTTILIKSCQLNYEYEQNEDIEEFSGDKLVVVMGKLIRGKR